MSQGHQGCGCGCGEAHALSRQEARRWRQAPEGEPGPCAGVDKAAVLAAIEAGAYTPALVKAMTQAGREPGCKTRKQCEGDVAALVALYAQPPCQAD